MYQRTCCSYDFRSTAVKTSSSIVSYAWEEGTGAVAVFPLLEMAADIYQTMSTFEQFDMEPYQPLT